MRKSQKPGEDEIEIGLYHRKINTGKLLRPMGFTLMFDSNEHKVTVDSADIKAVPELAASLPLRERIAGLLAHGKMTTEELSQELETTTGTVRACLNRHRKQFIKLGNEWGLLANGIPCSVSS